MATTQPKPVRERPRLRLDVDLGEKVSEDLRIDTPARPTLAARPQLAARPAVSRPKVARPRIAYPVVAGRATSTRARARVDPAVRKLPAVLRTALIDKVLRVFPPDGLVCFALTHDYEDSVGDNWQNYGDAMFWLATEVHVAYAIDEWANSEYEWVLEMFSENEPDTGVPARIARAAGGWFAPAVEDLYEAWERFAHGDTEIKLVVEVQNDEGTPIETDSISAGDLMGHWGITDPSVLLPTVVIAVELREPDLTKILDDEEVWLDQGYVITKVTEAFDVPTVHIAPK